MLNEDSNEPQCPAERVLKLLSGKWKPQIFKLAISNPLRFSQLLRDIPGSNKQSIAVALKEMEADGLVEKTTIREKPLHIEYSLTEKGQSMVVIFRQLEGLG